MGTNLSSGQGRRLPIVRERVHSWPRRAGTMAAGVLAIGMGYGVVFGHNGLTAFAAKRQETRSLQQQMQLLQVENERLQSHVERLQSDPSAIEHQAREQLHYTRAGEVIYAVSPQAAGVGVQPKAN